MEEEMQVESKYQGSDGDCSRRYLYRTFLLSDDSSLSVDTFAEIDEELLSYLEENSSNPATLAQVYCFRMSWKYQWLKCGQKAEILERYFKEWLDLPLDRNLPINNRASASKMKPSSTPSSRGDSQNTSGTLASVRADSPVSKRQLQNPSADLSASNKRRRSTCPKCGYI